MSGNISKGYVETMFKRFIFLVLSILIISSQAVYAETLNTNLRINSIRVNGKNSKVFDRIRIKDQSYDTESANLVVNDSEGIVSFNFVNINNTGTLSSLLNEAKGTKVDLTNTITELVFTETENGESLVFNFNIKKATARRTKKGIQIKVNTETESFSCEDFDFDCEGDRNLKLRGRVVLKQ